MNVRASVVGGFKHTHSYFCLPAGKEIYRYTPKTEATLEKMINTYEVTCTELRQHSYTFLEQQARQVPMEITRGVLVRVYDLCFPLVRALHCVWPMNDYICLFWFMKAWTLRVFHS